MCICVYTCCVTHPRKRKSLVFIMSEAAAFIQAWIICLHVVHLQMLKWIHKLFTYIHENVHAHSLIHIYDAHTL